MSTVDKKIADEIIAGKYASDRVVRIVKYQNMFNGADAYGTIYEGGNLMSYHESPACINPVVYWDKGQKSWWEN